jgi:hypothetical protein
MAAAMTNAQTPEQAARARRMRMTIVRLGGHGLD